MLFQNISNSIQQGDIGESRAVYEFTVQGFTVSKPLTSTTKYDLIVEKDGVLKRVQVKTTRSLSKYGVYEASLVTSGGNRTRNAVRHREINDYDLLFVLAEDSSCWIIPAESFDSVRSISLGNKYSEFKV